MEDFAIPELPPWAEKVANDHRAFGLNFVTVKTLDSTDVSEEHSRITIPDQVNDVLHIYHSLNERAIIDSTEKEGPLGILNDGLNVFVFVPGMRLELKLSSWDQCEIATNFKGSENWLRCVEYLKLKEGDKVAIWIFRIQENGDKKYKLCFIFHKL